MLERAVKCMNEKCHCLDIRLLWFSAKWAKPEMWLSWKGKPKKKIACRPRVSLIQDNNVSSGFYGYHKANLNNFSYCLIRWSNIPSYIWATFLKWTTIWHGANPLTLALMKLDLSIGTKWFRPSLVFGNSVQLLFFCVT